MWTFNLDIFEFDDVAKSCAVSYRTINQYGGTVGLVSESCVETGEFDFNTLRVEGVIFESGKRKLRIQKYADMC